MSDENERDTETGMAASVSRRESLRMAAAVALGAGLGVPSSLAAMAPAGAAVQLQVKFYKATSDGGTLVGGAALTDAITTFLASAAGARTQIKWYDWSGRELGTMGLPSLIQDKVLVGLSAGLIGQPYETLIQEYLALPLKDTVKEKWLYGNAARVFGLA